MKAMILAAGFGTRLHPLTKGIPKALVPLAGRPLLEILLGRLIDAGFDRVAVNAHHYSDQVVTWLHRHPFSGVEIQLSIEQEILGTGGGIKKMISLLGDDEPILVHNVDVLTSLPVQELFQAHRRSKADVTLAVHARQTKRYLLFDDQALLSGRIEADRQSLLVRHPQGDLHQLAFNGIQVIEPMLFLNYSPTCFSSIDLYLTAAAQGARVVGRRMDEWYWRDLGKPGDLAAAEQEISEGRIKLVD